MEIKRTTGPTSIPNNTETLASATDSKQKVSKGIAESRDSFETDSAQPNSLFSDFGIITGPIIGTAIGKAIGNYANDGDESAATPPLNPSEIRLQSTSANDEAADIAEKQRDLIQGQKEPRRRTYSLTTKPDDD